MHHSPSSTTPKSKQASSPLTHHLSKTNSLSAGAKSKMKSSAQRAVRARVLEDYPGFEPYIDEILPKKGSLETVKLPDRTTLYALDGQPLFWQHMDDALVPHLRLCHAFPDALPSVGIDRGAIRFVLSGAALMAPGLTSAGGQLPRDGEEEIEAGTVVVVKAEGKESVCLVGPLKMGTKEIREKKKGVVMDAGHYLGDGLWGLSLD